MKKMDLSVRMKTVADMVIQGAAVADIGCDHAFVSIYLMERQRAKRVIASDVRPGPLSIAYNNIKKRNMEQCIELRQGDGLAAIRPYEVDTIILAGMGGILMNRILEQKKETVFTARQLVLQPQSDLCLVRKKLRELGIVIVREEMVVDMGKYYTILDARTKSSDQPPDSDSGDAHAAQGSYDPDEKQELYDRYGEYLLAGAHPVLLSYLKKQYADHERILAELETQSSEKARIRADKLKEEQDYILGALAYYGKT